ncbi:hypothetical protein BKP45_06910 [Anaerobacillus alkalidiazotrophicus]|uniref:Phosphoribosyltransferase domain-containing protein n=1 Tax=Anaerobacillus alkalidiazotrophicus TaxID=472963 RepID=A0A1S2MCG5_9BACI|nr:ComF family protein [Anaerobacillus alkalidiazotrophicus]OIJ22359.1 hypothetical protein BKP45_06910 [Anaerobacillus alkalidiazotrophicus]
MNCLWCHEYFIEKVCWHYVFGLSTPPVVCERCREELELILDDDICDKCGRPFRHLASEYRQGNLCNDCVRWGDRALTKNRSLYVYNEFLQEVIAKWKYRGDSEIAKLFCPSLKRCANEFGMIDAVIPVPLSDERLYERSFNQAKMLAEALPYPLVEILKRNDRSTKQSKKSRKERLEGEERFQMVPSFPYDLQGKTILLVDDIYTTGATLHSAANVLKENGAATIFSLTVARG